MAEGSTTTRAIRAPSILTRRRRSEPDAALIEWCASLDMLERQVQATRGDYPAGSPEEEAEEAKRQAIKAQEKPLVRRIVGARATTEAGHCARAASLQLWEGGCLEKDGGPEGLWNSQILWALVRDLVGNPAP